MKSLFLADSRGKLFTSNEKILYFLVAGLFISLFLKDMPVISNIFTGGLLLHSFFYNTLSEKKQLLRQRKAIWLILLFYLLHMISAALSINGPAAQEMLVRRLPLLIFPLSIGLLTIGPELKNRILICFCTITTLTALICVVSAFCRYTRFSDSSQLYDDNLTLGIGWQSVYFALVVNLALFSYLYLLFKPGAMSAYRWLWGLSIIFLLTVNFMLASRIAILLLYGGLTLFAVVKMISEKRFKMTAGLAIALLILIPALIKVFPKVLNRFRELEFTNYSYNNQGVESHYNMEATADQWNGANIRLAVWQCGWELAKQHWLTGVRLGDKEDRLMDVYREKNFVFALASKRNMHNTYLDIFACFGIAGLALFLGGWLILPFLISWRDRDWVGLYMIATFAVSMITESYFDRSIGCLLAGFFLCFVQAVQPVQRSSRSGALPFVRA